MYKFDVVENFISLEGEAKYANRPTVYTRLARCNFTCWGFNNPVKNITNTGYAPLTFHPKEYKTIFNIPLIEVGCDSQYAVNPEFSHMWEKMNVDELIENIIQLLPHRKWQHPTTGLDYIFSITGGEPTIHWKFLNLLFNHEKMVDCKHILIETNGAVKFKEEFIDQIGMWLCESRDRKWTWSISPKLKISGEDRKDAIVPSVIALMSSLVRRYPDQCDMYFKFVCSDTDGEFAEVASVMGEYYKVISPNQEVWIMPMACSDTQQNAIVKKVAQKCILMGYNLSYRMQNAIWGNGVGT